MANHPALPFLRGWILPAALLVLAPGALGCTGPDVLRPVTPNERTAPPEDTSEGPLPPLPSASELEAAERARADREAAERRAAAERAAALDALRTTPRVRGEMGSRPSSWPSSAESMVQLPIEPSSKLILPEAPKPKAEPPGQQEVHTGAIHAPRLLGEEDVQGVFRQHQETFEGCSRIDPAAEGVVRMRFLVAASGSVILAEPLGSSVGNVDVVKCTIEAVQKFRFPEVAAGTGEVFYNVVYGNPSPLKAAQSAPPPRPAVLAPARAPEPVAAPQFPAPKPAAEPRRGRTATRRPAPARR